MVGIAIIALPSGIVTAGYLDELRSRKEARKSTATEGESQEKQVAHDKIAIDKEHELVKI